MEWSETERLSELELDDLLREWKIAAPLKQAGRARLPKPRGRRGWRIAALAAAFLLALAAEVLWHHPAPPSRIATAARHPDERNFTPIPYTIPLGQDERWRIVRMDIPVAELLAAGFRMPAVDPTGAVSADVLVGEDGSAHAIRLVPGVSRNSNY